MPGTTLCILFNHPYEKNIPLLEDVYRRLFDRVHFILPCARTGRVNVTTTYRGSFIFHGMIVDAALALLSDRSEFFFFMQDDVLLNLCFSGAQWVERLNLPESGAFIPEISECGGPITGWSWLLPHVWRTTYPRNPLSGSGVESLLNLLPDAKQAFETLRARYGFSFADYTRGSRDKLGFYPTFASLEDRTRLEEALIDGLFRTAPGGKISAEFPFCCGMSDFFAVDRATFEGLVHLLGVFAATQIFAEIAIPTALALTARDRVTRCRDIGMEPAWWWEEDRKITEPGRIAAAFSAGTLLLAHPVKLSRDHALFAEVARCCLPRSASQALSRGTSSAAIMPSETSAS